MFTRNRIELTGTIARPAVTEGSGEGTVTRARLIHDESIKRINECEDPINLVTAIGIRLGGRLGRQFAEQVTTETPVYIEGRLQLDEWVKDGERFMQLYVWVTHWQLLGADERHDNRAMIPATAA